MSKHNVFVTLGASNHSNGEREAYDLYCTHPRAAEALCDLVRLDERIWEICDGLGHLSNVFLEHGHKVRRSDIITRGRDIEQLDFLSYDGTWDGDIVTNPPYRNAIEFVKKALSVVKDGNKVCMFLRTLFLEGKERKKLFEICPPKVVYVSSSRIPCGAHGKFGHAAQSYAWFVWERGYQGETKLKWF